MHKFTVQLIDPTGDSEPEIVYASADPEECLEWVKTWLDDHFGLGVAIMPPSNTRPVCGTAEAMDLKEGTLHA